MKDRNETTEFKHPLAEKMIADVDESWALALMNEARLEDAHKPEESLNQEDTPIMLAEPETTENTRLSAIEKQQMEWEQRNRELEAYEDSSIEVEEPSQAKAEQPFWKSYLNSLSARFKASQY